MTHGRDIDGDKQPDPGAVWPDKGRPVDADPPAMRYVTEGESHAHGSQTEWRAGNEQRRAPGSLSRKAFDAPNAGPDSHAPPNRSTQPAATVARGCHRITDTQAEYAGWLAGTNELASWYA